MTAKTGAAESERCFKAGATGYIAKPVENGLDFLQTLTQFVANEGLASGVSG